MTIIIWIGLAYLVASSGWVVISTLLSSMAEARARAIRRRERKIAEIGYRLLGIVLL